MATEEQKKKVEEIILNCLFHCTQRDKALMTKQIIANATLEIVKVLESDDAED